MLLRFFVSVISPQKVNSSKHKATFGELMTDSEVIIIKISFLYRFSVRRIMQIMRYDLQLKGNDVGVFYP
jgi:hypothetical protein